MILTGEITVSKLFPAGFGWQAGSMLAAKYGFSATEIPLWLAAGVGDFLGVFLGHLIYMSLKKSIVASKKTMADEFGVAIWLATAAFCSGTAWQPVVNFFVGTGLSFAPVALCTTATCAAFFFGGLRFGRIVYTGLGIEKSHPRNFAEDAGLSVAIGGASGMFVGTDVTIIKNPIDAFVGVYPEMSTLQACTKAGTSTGVGFALFHTLQNTRAQASSAYVTKESFKDIAISVLYELSKTKPSFTEQEVRKFVDSKVDGIFEKLDSDGDGKLIPEEVKLGLESFTKLAT